MDHPTDFPPAPHPPENTRTSVKMSTVTNRTASSTSSNQEPAPTSNETRPTTEPSRQSSSSAPPQTSSEPAPSSEPTSEPTPEPTPTSQSQSPPPPPPPSSTPEPSPSPSPSSPEISVEPTTTSSSELPTTTSELTSTTSTVDPTTTSLFTSAATSSSPSATATITPIPSAGGLTSGAKIGLGAGLGGAFALVIIVAIVHFGRRQYRNRQENKKRVQDIEENAQLAAFQAQMAQAEPTEDTRPAQARRGSAMFGIHPTRFGDVEQESVQHDQQYQPYTPGGAAASGYRGFKYGVN